MGNTFEVFFDIWYFISIFILGILLLKNSKKGSEFKLFGFMAIILGIGDTFHLIPRVVGILSPSNYNVTALGIGSMITSITMTFFYLLMYYAWRIRYNITGTKKLTCSIWTIAILRALLCLAPQNAWTSTPPSYTWNILRNIPFNIFGIIMIILFYIKAKEKHDLSFKYMWLGITLSFIFYLPVILFVHIYPMLGMLMLPKTIVYVWIVWKSYKIMKLQNITNIILTSSD